MRLSGYLGFSVVVGVLGGLVGDVGMGMGDG